MRTKIWQGKYFGLEVDLSRPLRPVTHVYGNTSARWDKDHLPAIIAEAGKLLEEQEKTLKRYYQEAGNARRTDRG